MCYRLSAPGQQPRKLLPPKGIRRPASKHSSKSLVTCACSQAEPSPSPAAFPRAIGSCAGRGFPPLGRRRIPARHRVMLSVAKHLYQPCTSQPPRKLWLVARQKEILRSAQNDRLSSVAAAAQGRGGERFDGLQTAWTNVYAGQEPPRASARPLAGRRAAPAALRNLPQVANLREVGPTPVRGPPRHARPGPPTARKPDATNRQESPKRVDLGKKRARIAPGETEAGRPPQRGARSSRAP